MVIFKNMKYLIYSSLVFLPFLVNSQISLSPEVMSYPDISQEAYTKYIELTNRYEVISKNIETFGKQKISDEDLEFWLTNEMTVVDGSPFNTGIEGCSWYCGAQIKQIKATSFLKNSAGSNYKADNIHDFDLRTTWATDKNKGIDEKLTIHFPYSENLSLTHIEIYNGYQKSESVWKNNSRAKKIELFINGKSTYILHLQDTLKMQRFSIGKRFSPHESDLIVQFKVLEIYPGDKYDDLCISEINFDGAGDH